MVNNDSSEAKKKERVGFSEAKEGARQLRSFDCGLEEEIVQFCKDNSLDEEKLEKMTIKELEDLGCGSAYIHHRMLELYFEQNEPIVANIFLKKQ